MPAKPAWPGSRRGGRGGAVIRGELPGDTKTGDSDPAVLVPDKSGLKVSKCVSPDGGVLEKKRISRPLVTGSRGTEAASEKCRAARLLTIPMSKPGWRLEGVSARTSIRS